jgi:hypothetical protein
LTRIPDNVEMVNVVAVAFCGKQRAAAHIPHKSIIFIKTKKYDTITLECMFTQENISIKRGFIT